MSGSVADVPHPLRLAGGESGTTKVEVQLSARTIYSWCVFEENGHLARKEGGVVLTQSVWETWNQLRHNRR